MPGLASFGELLAAKAGQQAPELEQSLARTAEQSEASRMAQQARDYEYQRALEQANGPTSPNPLQGIVPEASAVPEVSTPINLSAPSDVDVAKFANMQDASAKYNALKNPKALAAIAAGGIGATALMNSGPSVPPPSMAGPSPASTPGQKPEEAAPESSEAKELKSNYNRIMSMLEPKKPEVMEIASPGSSIGSDDALKQAQSARDTQVLINQLGKSGALIAAGLAKAKPGAADSIFDKNIDLANNKVKDYQDRLSNQDSNPGSAASQAMRGIALKMGFKFGDNVSAEDIKKQIPQLTSFVNHQDQIEAMRQTKAAALLTHQDAMKDKMEEKQNKAYSELANHLETFRGNRVAQQAAMDQYSAAKALDMVKNKDPNTLTSQDLQLLAGEMSKIATGGVPTEHGIKSLMPDNLNLKNAEMRNFLLSKPSDAQAGEYVKKNMKYLQDMVHSADGVLHDYRSNILRGYKGRVKDEQYNEAQKTYGLGQQAEPQYEQDVLNYAKSHNISPEQAQAIKQQRTGGR